MRQGSIIFSVGMIAFFVGMASALFLLPFWVRPFLAAVEKGNPSDWIGFAGNFGAGAMTLIAAAIAWSAVQKQIAIQQEIANKQTAIQQFTILQGTLSFLQEENRLNDRIKLEGMYTRITENTLRTNPLYPTQIESAGEWLGDRFKAIQALSDEFERAGHNISNFPAGRRPRQMVNTALSFLNAGYAVVAQALSQIQLNVASSENLSPQDRAIAAAIDFSKESKRVADECSAFEQLLSDEIYRVEAAMNSIRSQAGL
jgi:hypothetical protein